MTRFATHDGIPVWTTFALTIHADGSANRQFAGASFFPGTGSTTATASGPDNQP